MLACVLDSNHKCSLNNIIKTLICLFVVQEYKSTITFSNDEWNYCSFFKEQLNILLTTSLQHFISINQLFSPFFCKALFWKALTDKLMKKSFHDKISLGNLLLFCFQNVFDHEPFLSSNACETVFPRSPFVECCSNKNARQSSWHTIDVNPCCGFNCGSPRKIRWRPNLSYLWMRPYLEMSAPRAQAPDWCVIPPVSGKRSFLGLCLWAREREPNDHRRNRLRPGLPLLFVSDSVDLNWPLLPEPTVTPGPFLCRRTPVATLKGGGGWWLASEPCTQRRVVAWPWPPAQAYFSYPGLPQYQLSETLPKAQGQPLSCTVAGAIPAAWNFSSSLSVGFTLPIFLN